VEAHLEALRALPDEFVQAVEALNQLTARVLAQDAEGMLAELKKSSTGKKVKAKVIGGNA
jgi:hypothetical protein